MKCDVTDPPQVDAAFDTIAAEHGPVEVLVANAGITRDTLLLRMSDDDWDAVIETNLTGSFRVAKRAAKGMLRLRRGRIVFISSVVGLLGSPGQVNYAASKSGLIGMARSMARELGSRGITTNVVAPGFVETDMTAVLPEETQKQYLSQIPLGRFGLDRRDRERGPLDLLRRGRLHHRRGDPGRRRHRHGPLTPPTTSGKKGHAGGHPRRQADPGRGRHARLLDRFRHGQGGAGTRRHRADLELRPRAEHHQTDRETAAGRAAGAGAGRHRRGAPGRAAGRRP